jgi:hypothetical protein
VAGDDNPKEDPDQATRDDGDKEGGRDADNGSGGEIVTDDKKSDAKDGEGKTKGRPLGSKSSVPPLYREISGYMKRREVKTTPTASTFMNQYTNYGYHEMLPFHSISENAMRKRATFCIEQWESVNGECSDEYRYWAHLRFRGNSLLEEAARFRALLQTRGFRVLYHLGKNSTRSKALDY